MSSFNYLELVVAEILFLAQGIRGGTWTLHKNLGFDQDQQLESKLMVASRIIV